MRYNRRRISLLKSIRAARFEAESVVHYVLTPQKRVKMYCSRLHPAYIRVIYPNVTVHILHRSMHCTVYDIVANSVSFCLHTFAADLVLVLWRLRRMTVTFMSYAPVFASVTMATSRRLQTAICHSNSWWSLHAVSYSWIAEKQHIYIYIYIFIFWHTTVLIRDNNPVSRDKKVVISIRIVYLIFTTTAH